ncbi:radical SAM protein [uncultured Eubacterium sp.]|uniref:elongator complex protein 3 n=1 Tax=uncultured Eubacterium sp. TaxID=165185 RepID=UPI0015C045EA|nr:radical SAM protein [uncultured Eubacterium sp.]
MKKGNISIFIPHLGCPQQCSFCNQKTITGNQKQPTCDDVISAVETALRKKGYEYEIAFFGGSFTAIDREYMLSLLKTAYTYVSDGKVRGIRISTRPDCIDDEILDILKAYGVTSIELGAQSMDDEVLKANLRGHTAQDVENASRLIKSYGFELGLQMMTGLYLDTDEKAVETAKRIIALQPSTVRIYPTVVLKGTMLARLYEDEVFKPQTVDDAANLCTRLVPMFEDAGIKVIRLGLHASDDIKKNAVAGAYHESFGEIVKSRYMLNRILKYKPGDYEIMVNPRSVSQLKGQQKRNIYFLMEEGYNIKVTVTDKVAQNDLKIIRR